MNIFNKKIATLAFSTAIVIGLSACNATDAMNTAKQSFSNAKDYLLNTTIDVSKPWQNEPLLTDDGCNTFTFENISSFIENYYIPSKQAGVPDKDASMDTLENYLLSAVLVNRANLCLAEALELKDLTDDLKQERDILLGGTSISTTEMEKHRAFSETASTQIQDTIAEIDSLDPEKKERLTIGISTLIGGSYTFVQTYEHALVVMKEFESATGFSYQQLLNQGSKLLGKGRVLVFVYDGMYDVGKSWMASTKALYDFSLANDIDIPDDATSMYRNIRSSQTASEVDEDA